MCKFQILKYRAYTVSFKVPDPNRETSESELKNSRDREVLIRNEVKPVGQIFVDYCGDGSGCWKEGRRQG
jgi:hypothetical protein